MCESITCAIKGAEALYQALKSGADPAEVRVLRAPCMGRCDTAPVAEVGHYFVDIEIGSLYNVVYIISRFLLLYYLLNIPIAAFEASMISSLSSSAISYTVVNVIAKKFGIFQFS